MPTGVFNTQVQVLYLAVANAVAIVGQLGGWQEAICVYVGYVPNCIEISVRVGDDVSLAMSMLPMYLWTLVGKS
eukprot:COSAG01_NODE_63745_length_279_cov_0.388889_1_plen_73_part_01